MPLPLWSKSATFLTSSPTEATSPSTRFAFKLFRELMARDNENLLFSPSSVMRCGLMIYEAAAGKTRQAMAKALEIANLDPVDTQLTICALKGAFGCKCQRKHTVDRLSSQPASLAPSLASSQAAEPISPNYPHPAIRKTSFRSRRINSCLPVTERTRPSINRPIAVPFRD